VPLSSRETSGSSLFRQYCASIRRLVCRKLRLFSFGLWRHFAAAIDCFRSIFRLITLRPARAEVGILSVMKEFVQLLNFKADFFINAMNESIDVSRE
jgi:hypothetical protein